MRLIRRYSKKSGCPCSRKRSRFSKNKFYGRLPSYYAKQAQDLLSDYDGYYMTDEGDLALVFNCETDTKKVDKCKFAAIDIESGEGINMDVKVFPTMDDVTYVAIVPDKEKVKGKEQEVLKVYAFVEGGSKHKMYFIGKLPPDIKNVVKALSDSYLIVENPENPEEHWVIKVKKDGRQVIEGTLKKDDYKIKNNKHEIEILPMEGDEIIIPYSNKFKRSRVKYYSSDIIQELEKEYEHVAISENDDIAFAFDCKTSKDKPENCNVLAFDLLEGEELGTNTRIIKTLDPEVYALVIPYEDDKYGKILKVYSVIPPRYNNITYVGFFPEYMGNIVEFVDPKYVIVENPRNPKMHALMELRQKEKPIILYPRKNHETLEKGKYEIKAESGYLEIISTSGTDLYWLEYSKKNIEKGRRVI